MCLSLFILAYTVSDKESLLITFLVVFNALNTNCPVSKLVCLSLFILAYTVSDEESLLITTLVVFNAISLLITIVG